MSVEPRRDDAAADVRGHTRGERHDKVHWPCWPSGWMPRFISASHRSARRASLYPMHVIAALPSRHRFANKRLLEVTELADEPVLVLQSGFGSREWFDIACDMAHIKPRVLLENAAPHTLASLVATG